MGMTSPFQRIRIDGNLLEGDAIPRWSADLAARVNAPWAFDLHRTLEDLVSGDGSLPASTSGTTGPPRSMRIPAADLIASAQLTANVFGLRSGDRALLCLPCTFIAGKMMVVRAFVTGLDLVAIDPTGPVLPRIAGLPPFRFATFVPQQFLTALRTDATAVEGAFGTVLLGGGPVSDALIAATEPLRIEVYHSYGSTETVTHVALRRLNGPQHSSMFTAIGDVTFAFDEQGRLIVHTPHLSTATHRTNDVVELVDERRFHWLGRADHVILSGGLKIHPEQLEARTTGTIAPAHYFIGVPDERLGQAVAIVLEAGSIGASERAELERRLATVLARHEMPRRWFVHRHLPRTSSGKVIRRAP